MIMIIIPSADAGFLRPRLLSTQYQDSKQAEVELRAQGLSGFLQGLYHMWCLYPTLLLSLNKATHVVVMDYRKNIFQEDLNGRDLFRLSDVYLTRSRLYCGGRCLSGPSVHDTSFLGLLAIVLVPQISFYLYL